MTFMNPELLSITQSKELGIWAPGNLSSFGVLPYIKRLKKPKIRILDVGVDRGENAFLLFDSNRGNKIEKIVGIKYSDEFDSLLEINLKDYEERFSLELDDSKFDVVCINTGTSKENLDKVFDMYYDRVNSNGIFCGNNHSQIYVKESLSKLRRNKKIGIPINVSFDNFFWNVR